MDFVCPSQLCTGCLACSQICRKQAIKVVSREGFNYPEIDHTKCNDCGLCKKICPVLKEFVFDPLNKPLEAYVIKKDDSALSSSGGCCAQLYTFCVKNNFTVCGCVLDGTYAHHILSKDPNDINKMLGSKYIQSDLSKVYKEIKATLINSKVLFIGTPCQVAAIKRIAGKYINNLYTVDLFCHGVCSQNILTSCINEELECEKVDIEQISFRNKDIFNFTIKAKMQDSEVIVKRSQEESLFYKIFLNNLALRESCGQCVFAGRWPREGDLSCGDPWGLDNQPKGSSIVFINTEKGKYLFDKIKDTFDYMNSLALDLAQNSQHVLINSSRHNPLRKNFLKSLESGNTITQTLNSDLQYKNVGVLNFSYAEQNYGAVLNAAGLCQAIKQLGYNVQLIDYLCYPGDMPFSPAFREFKTRELPLTRRYDWSENLDDLNKKFETFVVGSDQVFNYEYMGKDKNAYLLTFSNLNKLLIGYAVSFGKTSKNYINGLDEYYKEFYKSALQMFEGLSVRENNTGLELCDLLEIKNAQAVLDPVFLCDKSWWLERAQICKEEGFDCVTYFINDKNKIDDLKLSNEFSKVSSFRVDGEKSPYQWLKAISESKVFLTDSFHGVAFAIIFNKSFVVVNTSQESLIRIYELLDLLAPELKSRVFDTVDLDFHDVLMSLKEPNWEEINSRIKALADFSINWLKNNLDQQLSDDRVLAKKELRQRMYKLARSHEKPLIYKHKLKSKFYKIMFSITKKDKYNRKVKREKIEKGFSKLTLRYLSSDK